MEGGGSSHLGEVVRNRRRELGLSQDGLSWALEELGVRLPRSSLSRIENGQALPDAHQFAGLCRVLGLPPVALLESLLAGVRRGSSAAPAETLLREAEEFVRSGAVRAARGRFQDLLDTLRTAGSGEAAGRLAPRALLGAAWCALQELAFEGALDLASRAANHPAARPGDRLRALAMEARCLAALGRLVESRALAARAAAEAEGPAADEPRLAGFVFGMLGEASRVAGEPDRAAELFRRAADAWTRASLPIEVARARVARAGCLLETGRDGEAREEAREALELARSLAPGVLPEALVAVARTRAADGEAAEAVRAALEAAEMARELGRARVEFVALLAAREAREEDDPEITRRLDHLAPRLAGYLAEARRWLAERASGEEEAR